MQTTAAILTAPRPVERLGETLVGLGRAGWDRVLVGYDGKMPAEGPPRVGLQIDACELHAGDDRGPWPSLLRLAGLILDDASWELALLLQDDVWPAAGLRQAVEAGQGPWRFAETAVTSLWCCGWLERQHAQTTGLAWFHLGPDELPRRFYGALATLWTRRRLGELVRGAPRRLERNRADYWLGAWCKAAGAAPWFPTRSLVQHTGDVSAIRSGPLPDPYNYRWSERFLAECPEISTTR